MKKILALLLVAATMLAVPTSVFAAEAEADTVVIEQHQNETKPTFKFGKGFANFKKFDKKALREKLDEMLAEGKITQEKYDSIISGEWKPSLDGKKKFPAFPEGFKKPERGEFTMKNFGKFKDLDKEAIREKLDEMLAEGKITQEKYDAIISSECKPSFDGKKFPIFQNKNTDAENETTDESTVKTRPAFGKRTGGKFPAMKKGFQFAGAKG